MATRMWAVIIWYGRGIWFRPLPQRWRPDDVDLAVRVLRYLASIQFDDGGMPQNCWVDGRPHWRGIQLDEVAFPIMLAWHLYNKGLLGGFDPFPMVKAGAAYIIKWVPALLRNAGKKTRAFPHRPLLH